MYIYVIIMQIKTDMMMTAIAYIVNRLKTLLYLYKTSKTSTFDTFQFSEYILIGVPVPKHIFSRGIREMIRFILIPIY